MTKTETFDDLMTQDVFDIRDVIARYEEIEDTEDSDEQDERDEIKAFLDEVQGRGGDEQWRGDWYPVGFVRDSYFTEYAEELLKDCGDLPQNIPHYIEIDWEKTANNIRVDYSSVDVGGTTYWYR